MEYETLKKGRPVVGIRFKVMNRHIVPSVEEKKKVYLNVNFDDNTLVKELGAKFDMNMRSWYIYTTDDNYQQFNRWFVTEGCLTDSQANVVVNDILFQMDFAGAGTSMSNFKREMKLKLKEDLNFVQENSKRLNEIFGKNII